MLSFLLNPVTEFSPKTKTDSVHNEKAKYCLVQKPAFYKQQIRMRGQKMSNAFLITHKHNIMTY